MKMLVTFRKVTPMEAIPWIQTGGMFMSTNKARLLGVGIFAVAGIVFASTNRTFAITSANKLQSRVTASWQGQQLAVVLDRIAASLRIDFWIDRRVDPQQLVDAQFNDAPLAEVLDGLTADAALGWSLWEGNIYIGPRRSAGELATLLAIARYSLKRVPAPARQKWLRKVSASWPRLSDPRDILEAWLAESEIELSGRELLSHDLWEANELPSLSLVDRVVLLLAGYDMTCEIASDGNLCRVVPIKRPVRFTRGYRATSRVPELLAEFSGNPAVSINRKGNQIAITGRWEDLQLAEDLLRGGTSVAIHKERSAPREVQRVISMRLVNQPVGKVVDQLAEQLELEVKWSADAATRDNLVSCDVSNGTLHDLVEAVLTPAGLEFKLTEKRLEVLPSQ